MIPSDYSELTDRLYRMNLHGVKKDLNKMLQLTHLLGNPEKCFAVIHVAGTNGKGSVATKIAKGLELAGLRIGLFTSPHLYSFCERIQVNSIPIAEERAAIHLKNLFKLTEKEKISPTFFELTTCLALNYFAEEKCSIVILEVGIGGRLDATNIVSPCLSIITSISLDHMEILGPTLQDIAYEKSGVIKPFIPVVIGPHVPWEIMHAVAKKQKSPLYQVTGIYPTYDAENSAIAYRALELLKLDKNIINEAVKIRPPCRMQYIKKKHLILDVAHNPDGLKRLFESLHHEYGPNLTLRAVFGLSHNKEISACLSMIHKYAHFIHFVTATNGRGIAAEELMEYSNRAGYKNTAAYSSIEEGLKQAFACRTNPQELIVVCGSFFIINSINEGNDLIPS